MLPIRTMSTDEQTLNHILKQDSDIEASKGYWTDNTNGYVDIAVLHSGAIALSSGHWYRVQKFQLPNTNDEQQTECWTFVKQLLKECGRKLPVPSDDGVYRITNLSSQQANQMYYLLKHNLTSAKAEFELRYGLFIDGSETVKCPPMKKKRRLRSKRGKISVPAVNEWQN